MGIEMAVRGVLAAQGADAPRRRALRRQRLGAVLTAATTVPFYRGLHGSAGAPADVADEEDLWDVPAASKAELLAAGEDARVREGARREELQRGETSGSTGPALSFFATVEEALKMSGNLAWGWRQAGVGAADRGLLLAAPYLVAFERPGWVFAAPDASPEWILDQFEALRPTVLIGSTESIALLARDVARAGVDASQVRRLFPFGQTLSDPLRDMMLEGFAPRPNDLYGSQEAGWLGVECDEGWGLHVPDTSVVVQVARLGRPDTPADPGEPGEVIVTSLLRRTTPFIRYRIGDVAALDTEACACGRDTPRLTKLEGRVQDFLLSTDGRLVSPGVIATQVAYGRPGIEDHRIVQDAPDRVTVFLVAPKGLPDEEALRIREDLRRHLGRVEVSVRLLDRIPRDPSGKRRRVFRAFDETTAT
jgi:phenylacetate-CoA ligase